MINLLPIEEKKKMRAEYRFRLGIMIAFAVVVLSFINLILLSPVYLLTLSKYQFASEKLAELESEQGRTGQEKEINAQISAINKRVNLFLEKNKEQSLFSEVITKIIETKGPTIRIQNMSYELTSQKERFVVSGRADDRDILALFIESLKKDSFFTTVNIPISSYIKSTDIDFSVVLEKNYIPLKK